MNYLNVFLWIFESSLIGSVMVLLILIVRKLANKGLSPTIIYCFWVLLIIKLIIPFGPQSTISLYNIFNSSYESINNVVNTKNTSTPLVINSISNSSQTKNVNTNNAIASPSNTNNKYKETLTSTQLLQTILSYKQLYAYIWLFGIIFMIIFTLLGTLKIKNLIKSEKNNINLILEEILQSCILQTAVKQKIIIVTTDIIQSPCLYGIFKPALVIPNKIAIKLPEEQLKYIILHELCHLKRKDVIINWIISMLRIIYWFNPIILLGLKYMQIDCEMACDMTVLSYLGKAENIAYGNTIINVLELINKPMWLPGATAIIIKKSQLRRRIIMISRNSKLTKTSLLIGLTIILILGVIGLTGRANAVQLTMNKKAVEKLDGLKIKPEVNTDQNKIKNYVSVKEEKPTVDLGDLKQVNTTDATNSALLPRIMTTYRSPAGKELIIVQGNAEDNADISNLELPNRIGTTKVKGVNAAICEAKNAYTQITFVKNKKFYNVMGYKMTKDDLIEIAESLQ